MGSYLETDRLVLRRFTDGDVDAIVELDSDPVVMRYLTGGRATPLAEVRDEILPFWMAYYERGEDLGFWAAEEKATGQFLGWFHFRPRRDRPPADGDADSAVGLGVELGYRLRRSAWGKGYATEGSIALIRKGFTELGVDRVYAETMAINLGSRRVMEKAGLRYVRTFHQDWPEKIPGDEHGDVEYALTKAEWEAAGRVPGALPDRDDADSARTDADSARADAEMLRTDAEKLRADGGKLPAGGERHPADGGELVG